MPIYEYRCRGCGDDFEKYVHGPSAKVACPTCQSGDITRKLSVFGLKSDGNFMSAPTGGGGGCCGGGGGGGPPTPPGRPPSSPRGPPRPPLFVVAPRPPRLALRGPHRGRPSR